MFNRSGAPAGAADGSGDLSDPLSAMHQWGLRAVRAALNHLLDQDESARARLVPHAGRVLRIAVQPSPGATIFPALPDTLKRSPPLDLRVGEDGRLQHVAPEDPEPAVTMTLKASVDAVFDLIGQGSAGLQRHLRIEGDVLFAAAIGELARSLSWEVEEDLSRLTGDAIAHRFASGVSAQRAAAADLMRRTAQTLAGHFTSDPSGLVALTELRAHSESLNSLESRLSSLERRLRRRG